MADFDVKGLQGVLNALQQLPREVASKRGGPARAALAKGAKVIRDEARSLAPYDSEGDEVHIRNELVMKRDPAPQQSGANERYLVIVRRRAWYWRFKEFGTEKMRAEPFMRPAFEGKKEAALNVIIETLKTGIDRIAAKLAKGR
ncbi:HK97-gp10 family putative phage morphogenesis protein [Lysobacter fragariae]